MSAKLRQGREAENFEIEKWNEAHTKKAEQLGFFVCVLEFGSLFSEAKLGEVGKHFPGIQDCTFLG